MNEEKAKTKTVDFSELDDEKLIQLEKFIDNLGEQENVLIEVLHHAQSLFGYLSRDLQLFIARRLGISGAEVYGVVSFYSFFTMKPPGKHTINICTGTACHVRGSDKLLKVVQDELNINTGETTDDGWFTFKDVRCVGACGLAPVVMVDDSVYGHVQPDDMMDIIKKYQEKSEGRVKKTDVN